MKRFRDTNKVDKSWYMELPPRLKCAVDFIQDKCDNAGVWDINMTVLNMHVNDPKPITLAEILPVAEGSQFKQIAPRKIYCIGFITFQYGKLSEKSAPHRQVMALIEKHNLDYHSLDRVVEGLPSSPKDKEQEKEKGTDQEKEKDPPKILNLEVEKNIVVLKSDQLFHEQVCMALSIEMDEMTKKLDQFIAEKRIGDELDKPLNDCRRHFRDWLKIQIDKAKPKPFAGNSTGGQMPDYYNPKYEATLSGTALSTYWKHLNDNGWKPIKKKINGVEKVVDWQKVKAA